MANSSNFSPMNGRQSGWSPPPLGLINLNVDATIKGEECFLGVIARSSCGSILDVVTTDDFITNVEAAEAQAISFALAWALKRGWLSINVESDAQGIVLSLAGSDALYSAHWESSGGLQECLSLKASFSSCFFEWVPRGVNLAAHHACRWAMSVHWVGCVPCLALPGLLRDLLLEESPSGCSIPSPTG